MFNLFYQKFGPRLMCTFTNYRDCKKALKTLQKKYPNAKIWYAPLTTINSYEEWCDVYNKGEDIY